jgi:hypothetical protein
MGQDNTKNIEQADKKLVDLMVFGLNHGIESVKASGKGPLVPFIMTETNGERRLNRLMAERLEDGLDEGIKTLTSDKTSNYGIIVYDGYLTVDGQKYDAVIVKGFDRKDQIGYLIGQRYQLKKFLAPFKIVGSPTFVGNDEQLLK